MFLAAFDKRIKAVVAMIPAINQWENFLTAMPRDAFFGFLATLTQDREARYGSDQLNYLPLVAPPGQGGLMPDEAYTFYTRVQQTIAPNWANRITTGSLEKFVSYDPAGPIDLISPTPLLVIVADQDQIIPPAFGPRRVRAGPGAEALFVADLHAHGGLRHRAVPLAGGGGRHGLVPRAPERPYRCGGRSCRNRSLTRKGAGSRRR